MSATHPSILLSSVVELLKPRAVRLELILLLILLCISPVRTARSQPSTALKPSADVRAPSQSGTASKEVARRESPLFHPARSAEVIAYTQAQHQLYFVSFAWTIAVLLLLLGFRVAAMFRNWAESIVHDRFMQALIFVPAFLLTFDALSLPVDVIRHLVD